MRKRLPVFLDAIASPLEAALTEMQALADASAMALCADGESGETEISEVAMKAEIAQADLSATLRRAVEAAASQSAGSMAVLRAAVCQFTVAHRKEGLTPERVLVSLKEVIQRETLENHWNASTWGGAHLRHTISRWCIEDYFAETECPNLP
jgi:hypothetical protein